MAKLKEANWLAVSLMLRFDYRVLLSDRSSWIFHVEAFCRRFVFSCERKDHDRGFLTIARF
jgi:hypothetical protein